MTVRPIRIYFDYRVVDGPWGGANTFLTQLRAAVNRAPDFEMVESPHERLDLVFLNQLYRGPGRAKWSRRFTRGTEIERWKRTGRHGRWASSWLVKRHPGPRFVCRLVNLERHAYGRSSSRDTSLLSALRWTDVDVFQSEYLRHVFQQSGYSKPNSVVIHNGADTAVFTIGARPGWTAGQALRLVSCTFATRASKRFDLIAAASRTAGVEVRHIGRWPSDIDPGRVIMLGMLDPAAIAAVHRDWADAFLHPAERDICPNAVVEAMCAGLPVIFHPVGGTAELVGAGGVSVDESDVASSLDQLRATYDACRQHVLAARPGLSAEVAAARYLEIFRDVTAAART
jgi:glycosyltransferase involved in cell wall biosynthesis